MSNDDALVVRDTGSRFGDGKRAAGAALDLIADERARQLRLGHTADHDDFQSGGELAAAAACFAVGSSKIADQQNEVPRALWPENYPEALLKERTRIRCLVIAGALIVAEIERLQRAHLKSLGPETPVLSELEF